jgi:CRP-like cAMP-binding protein
MADPKVEALRRLPLLANSGHKELEFVASRADEVEVGAGKTLIKQGDPSEAFYLLLEGEADVEVDGRHRTTLGPGDFFGEISMLDRGPATASVITKTPVKLMVMSHAQFRDAIRSNDDLLGQVLAAMAKRLRVDSLERAGEHPG